RDRRLRRAGQLGQLLLRQPERLALLDDLLRDLREEPALVGVYVRKAFAELLEAFRAHSIVEIIAKALLTSISRLLWIAKMRYQIWAAAFYLVLMTLWVYGVIDRYESGVP